MRAGGIVGGRQPSFHKATATLAALIQPGQENIITAVEVAVPHVLTGPKGYRALRYKMVNATLNAQQPDNRAGRLWRPDYVARHLVGGFVALEAHR